MPRSDGRFTLQQKQHFLAEAAQPGNCISAVARRYGIAPSLTFVWKRQMEAGALTGLEAGENVRQNGTARLLASLRASRSASARTR